MIYPVIETAVESDISPRLRPKPVRLGLVGGAIHTPRSVMLLSSRHVPSDIFSMQERGIAYQSHL